MQPLVHCTLRVGNASATYPERAGLQRTSLIGLHIGCAAVESAKVTKGPLAQSPMPQ